MIWILGEGDVYTHFRAATLEAAVRQGTKTAVRDIRRDLAVCGDDWANGIFVYLYEVKCGRESKMKKSVFVGKR